MRLVHTQGVTQPPRDPEVPPATFGFVDNAERINSRACMVLTYVLCRMQLLYASFTPTAPYVFLTVLCCCRLVSLP